MPTNHGGHFVFWEFIAAMNVDVGVSILNICFPHQYERSTTLNAFIFGYCMSEPLQQPSVWMAVFFLHRGVKQ